MSGLYFPYQKMFARSLTNENIQYDVYEHMWPNPQNRIDKNIKCNEGNSRLHFTAGV